MESDRPIRGAIRFGSFELDLRAGELRKQGVKIKLQEQPFQILAMLLEHPGEVVTREELLERRATEYIAPFCLVEIDRGLGDRECTYENLLAYVEDGGNGWAMEVAMGPFLDELAEEPRCAELFRRLDRASVKK